MKNTKENREGVKWHFAKTLAFLIHYCNTQSFAKHQNEDLPESLF